MVPLQKDYKALKSIGPFKHFVYLLEEELPPEEVPKPIQVIKQQRSQNNNSALSKASSSLGHRERKPPPFVPILLKTSPVAKQQEDVNTALRVKQDYLRNKIYEQLVKEYLPAQRARQERYEADRIQHHRTSTSQNYEDPE